MADHAISNIIEICGDCSALNPQWASVNKCVLLCDECASLHRALGRHISQVKHLAQSHWRKTQFKMVRQLVSSGANSIWEFQLHDPKYQSRREREALTDLKPSPRELLYPGKTDFVKRKYQLLAFCRRYKESELGSVEELNRQLHASVRTANLETSLRLLAQGADPNYAHPEKQMTTPLHIACAADQALQAELLLTYGANAQMRDALGHTALDAARVSNHHRLLDQLIESQLELTDRLAYFVCQRFPDHERELVLDCSTEMLPSDLLDRSDYAREARAKLSALPDSAFQELCIDLHDEADRRELNSAAKRSVVPIAVHDAKGNFEVPFLPLNPFYSSTRNQGRQKLARLTVRELSTLVVDVLAEARRRLGNSIPLKSSAHHNNNNGNEVGTATANGRALEPGEEPVYDQVPGDTAEYGRHLGQSVCEQNIVGQQQRRRSVGVNTCAELKEQSVIALESEVTKLARLCGQLQEENAMLKRHVQQYQQQQQQGGSGANSVVNSSRSRTPPSGYETGHQGLSTAVLMRQNIRAQAQLVATGASPRPHTTLCAPPTQLTAATAADDDSFSYENVPTALPPPMQQLQSHQIHLTEDEQPPPVPPLPPLGASPIKQQQHHQRHIKQRPLQQQQQIAPPPPPPPPPVEDEYEERDYDVPPEEPQGGNLAVANTVSSSLMHVNKKVLPSQEEVVRRTETITRRIYDLLAAAREKRTTAFCACAENIHIAVREMTALLPVEAAPGTAAHSHPVRYVEAVSTLRAAADQLLRECAAAAAMASQINQNNCTADTTKVIQCCYNIARAAKSLVTLFQ